MLETTAEREIFVQIELWDQWDHNENRWAVSPWNPDNNVNYEASEVTLEGTGSYENVTAGSDGTHDLFMTVPAVQNDETVLRHQQRFVDEVLERAFTYDHVLYTITNELFTQHPPEWGAYWAGYVTKRAEEEGGEIYVTEMFQSAEIRGAPRGTGRRQLGGDRGAGVTGSETGPSGSAFTQIRRPSWVAPPKRRE